MWAATLKRTWGIWAVGTGLAPSSMVARTVEKIRTPVDRLIGHSFHVTSFAISREHRTRCLSGPGGVREERPPPNAMALAKGCAKLWLELRGDDIPAVVTRVRKEPRDRLIMATTEPCSHAICTLLSVLPMETELVEIADEPIGRLLDQERCEPWVEIAAASSLGPSRPLLRAFMLILRLVERPDLTVVCVMILHRVIRRHPWRQRL